MKIVIISDTHGLHRKIKNMPEGDIFIHAGDLTNVGEMDNYVDFNRWLGDLPYKHKIIVLGNHELDAAENLMKIKTIISNGIVLQDETINIEGFKIYGSAWTPYFGGWEFNLPKNDAKNGYTVTKEIWSKIPTDTNILITHGPPHMILDYIEETDKHAGCPILAARIEELPKLKLHAFGHIHHSHGIIEHEETIFTNACICDERYRPIQEPIMVEI
jgi:Icc-related predicted phosphoesterase